MCFFDHSFAHMFFVFHFVAKPMLEFRENMMSFSNCFKIKQLQLSLEEKSTFFAAPEVMTEFSAAWCLSIVSQGSKVHPYSILPVLASWKVAPQL